MNRPVELVIAMLLLATAPVRAAAAAAVHSASGDSAAARSARPARTHASHAATGTAASTRTPGRAAGMPRTLGDVHIEGEIPVPQVLFITARDQARFLDFEQFRYLSTSIQLGQATPLPAWIAVIHTPPVEPLKENSR